MPMEKVDVASGDTAWRCDEELARVEIPLDRVKSLVSRNISYP